MTKEEVAQQYLRHLEKGDVDKIISLFTNDAVVISPLYGEQTAKNFYTALQEDTSNSQLKYDGLFIEKDTNRMSLLFEYRWELKNGKIVTFKVVDIIEVNTENKIKKLTIIYDTIHSRKAIEGLR